MLLQPNPHVSLKLLGAGLLGLLLASIAATAQGKPKAAASNKEQKVQTLVNRYAGWFTEVRRHLHMYPELSNREVNTAKYIARQLRRIGFQKIQTGIARHGIVALLEGNQPEPVVAYRADMDALPIQETLNVPYRSRNPGVKHACGHDVHMAIALGVAQVLYELRNELPGSVKFIFQPAEEGPPEGEEGGAKLMVKEGALENPRPAAIFALHVNPILQVGTLGYTPGPALASADRIFIKIRGKRVHAAYPHQGIDPIVVAAHAVTALQTIRSRRVDTMEPFVLSFGKIQGGNRFNIIPEEVILEGTLRTLNEDVRARIHKLMEETLAGVTAAFGASYEIRYGWGVPVTYNDPKLVEVAIRILSEVVGGEKLIAVKPQMGAEDFSYYQKLVPGVMFWLGVGNRAKGITAMIHTADFDVDEASLQVGVKAMSTLLWSYLEHLNRTP